jgi:bromodomain-containing factor 1
VAQNCENYFEIVKEPIDLSTIEKQLIDGLYITPAQFNGDVRKIWANSYLYNQKGSPIYRMTTDMDKYF